MSSDEEDAAPLEKGDSKSLSLRIQKKMLGMTLKSTASAKHLVDETSGELLDTLHDIALKFSGSTKIAKKQLKDLIKIAVKFGLLYRHSQFNSEELATGNKFKSKFKMAALTMISYHDVAFTFDAAFLAKLMEDCKTMMKSMITRHLTAKSQGRVDNVFTFFGADALLTQLYTNPEYKDLLRRLVSGLNKQVEQL
eukprot:m.261027 g.261027  ORF g.261027 m.261027 type:complete len:195 (+) comp41138_c0_seq1:102-686(+)